jgi:hypothetical protein
MNQPTERQLDIWADAQARSDEGEQLPGDNQLIAQFDAFLEAAQHDFDQTLYDRESNRRVVVYALEMVADYTESGVEDDMDEDGKLATDDEHERACNLAYSIIRGMRANPAAVLALAKEPSEQAARWTEDMLFVGGPDPLNCAMAVHQDDAHIPGARMATRTVWAEPWRVVEEPGAVEQAQAAIEACPMTPEATA